MKTGFRLRIWKAIQHRHTSVCSEISDLSSCRCLKQNQKTKPNQNNPRDEAQPKKSGEQTFLFPASKPTPFDEIQCWVPRLGREGEREPGPDHSGNGHLYSASWNARCGWCSTPASDSSPQVTSCLFSLSCDPKLLTDEGWHSCLGPSGWSHWCDSQVIATTVGRAEESRAAGPRTDLAWYGGRA